MKIPKPEALEDELAACGWLTLRGLISEPEKEALLRAIAYCSGGGKLPSSQILFASGETPEGTPSLPSLMRQWLNPCLMSGEFSTHSQCEVLQNRLFGPRKDDWVLFQEILFQKDPGHETFHWHQDAPFFPVNGLRGFTCWVALDHCHAENGALMFATGSHKLGELPIVNLHTGARQDGSGFRYLPEGEIAQPELAAGDAVIFDPLCFHCSSTNHTDKPRRGWATVWFERGSTWDFARVPNHPMASRAMTGNLLEGWL